MAMPDITCPHCKAKCDNQKDANRFQRRHGANCKQKDRREFAQQLARGVRSVKEYECDKSGDE